MFVLFAFGAFTYASHPEGILEFQKRRWTLRMERLVFHTGEPPPALGGGPSSSVPAVGRRRRRAQRCATAASRSSPGRR